MIAGAGRIHQREEPHELLLVQVLSVKNPHGDLTVISPTVISEQILFVKQILPEGVKFNIFVEIQCLVKS